MRKENSIDLKRIFSAVSLKRIQSNLFVEEIVQNFCEKLLTNSANGNCPQSTSLIQQYNWEQILPHSKNSTCYKDFWKASNRTLQDKVGKVANNNFAFLSNIFQPTNYVQQQRFPVTAGCCKIENSRHRSLSSGQIW